MTCFRLLAVALALNIGTTLSTSAQDPLEHIPANADVIIRLKSPQQTIEKVAGLAEAVKTGAGDIVRQNAQQLDQLIGVRGLEGVDQSRGWYVLLASKPAGRPDVFFVIPATNADKLVAALPDRMVSRVEDDWVIYTATADQIPDPSQSGSGITTAMSVQSAQVFQRGDLSLFINTAHLSEVYADQIAHGHEHVDAVLTQIATAASQANGMNLEAILDMYGTIADGLFQALKDSRGASVGLVISDEGLQIEKHVAFAEGSPSARFVASNSTSEMKPLDQLPAGATGYFGLHGNMQRFIEWGWSVNAAMLSDDAEQKEKFEEAKRAWQQITFGDIVGAFELGSADDGLLQYMAIAQADPTEKVRDNMRQMLDVLGTIKTAGMTQTMTLQPDAETIDSHSIDLITVKQTFDPGVDPTGMQQKMQELMFGKGGMVSRIAFLDGFYAQTMGGGQQAMQELLKSIDAPSSRSLESARQGLSKQANLLFLIDLPNVAVSGLKFAESVPNVTLPIDDQAFARLQVDSSYVGYTLTTEKDALRVRVVIPTEQIRGVVHLVEMLRPRAAD